MPMVPDDRALSHPPDARLLGNDSEGCRECGYGTVSRPSGEPGLGDSRAEPLLRGRLLGKGRLLEPRSPSGQNARPRGGIERETEDVPLVSTRHRPPAIPIAPLQPLHILRGPGHRETFSVPPVPGDRVTGPDSASPPRGPSSAPRRCAVVRSQACRAECASLPSAGPHRPCRSRTRRAFR